MGLKYRIPLKILVIANEKSKSKKINLGINIWQYS
mgnify:CR=1 FL=1